MIKRRVVRRSDGGMVSFWTREGTRLNLGRAEASVTNETRQGQAFFVIRKTLMAISAFPTALTSYKAVGGT
jgi:hypothetical protein